MENVELSGLKNKSYGIVDLHNHSVNSFEPEKATYGAKKILDYFNMVAGIKNQDIAVAITDHDSCLGALAGYQIIKNNPERYKNIVFVPGMEANINLGHIIKYKDEKYGDEKFVYKKMHFLIHAKKGMEEEFFKRTIVYSKLSHMFVSNKSGKYFENDFPKDKNDTKYYVNVGSQILATRGIMYEKYGVRIPLNDFACCVKEGLTYNEIRANAVNVLYDNLKAYPQFANKTEEIAKQEIGNEIKCKKDVKNPSQSKSIFPTTIIPNNCVDGLDRLEPQDIKEMVGNCATLCFAHPETICLHKDTQLPVSALIGVDISSLDKKVQDAINKKLNDKEQVKNGFFSVGDGVLTNLYNKKDSSLKATVIDGDKSGIVKFQIINNALKKTGFEADGYELTKRALKKTEQFEQLVDTLVDKCGLLLNYGSDKHFNFNDDYQMGISNQHNRKTNKFYNDEFTNNVIENPYLTLNQEGKVKNCFTAHFERSTKDEQDTQQEEKMM